MTAATMELPHTYMVFVLGGKVFSFEARLLWEASTSVGFTEVPKFGGHLVGVTQMHGKIVPVLDMAGLLGMTKVPPPGGFIAVSLPGTNELLTGFTVDTVVGYAKIPPEDIQRCEDDTAVTPIPYLKGWVEEGKKFPLLDMERLVREQASGNTEASDVNQGEENV
jgi:chemotaxis signal transduction protein